MRRCRAFVWLFVLLTIGCATGGREIVSSDVQYANRGFEALSEGRYGDAEIYLDRALAENPNDPYATLNLGVVYQNTRRHRQAKLQYEKVIQMNPADIVAASNQPGKAGKTLVDLAKENLRGL